MSNSCTFFYAHLIFSTRNRFPFLLPEIQKEVWAYMAGIIEKNGVIPIIVGGVADHVHILIRTPLIDSNSELVCKVKASTSAWIKKRFPHIKGFSWQDGYGGFSVNPKPDNVAHVKSYIERQPQRHKTESFQDEIRDIFEEIGENYEDQSVWF